jgi:membrane peptidoglycan carboxypeptidase
MYARKIFFLLCSAVLAGLLVAAAAFPVAALAGELTRTGVDTFDRLPNNFLSLPTPQTSFLYASDGKTLIAKFFDENRRDVPLADVAPVMRQAIVASEDTRFYSHHGVDMKGVARSAVTHSGGASTLTMQYVRQSMIYSANTSREVVAASERTGIRKVREMKLALALEKKLTKDQILERYLNIAPFGHGAWGIYAASHVYFDKDPGALTLPEAALLAGLVQAPSDYDPLDPEKRPAALERREHVFAELIRAHQITPQQADEARRAPLVFTDKAPTQGCVAAAADLGLSCDYLYRWWLEQPAFGADPYARENRLRSGGYTIISSIDLDLQRAMKRNIDAKIKSTDRRALMLSAIEPATGHVLAMATNRDYSLDTQGNRPNPNPAKKGLPGTFPSTTNPLVSGGGDVSGYPAGSTFKMFTMVAALEQGVPLSYTIDTQARYHSKLYKTGPRDRSACPGSTDYCPGNASASEKGPFDMWSGFGHSVNTYFVPLEEKVGAEHAVDVASRMGIRFRADSDRNQAAAAHTWGAFTLGVSGTTPLDLAGAYATLANDGVHCAPTPVLEIRDFNGQRIDTGNPCQRAISADVARAALDAARCPVGDGGGLHRCNGATAGQVAGIVGRPVAGKTGTTDTNESATLVAMTRQVAVAGIEADPDWPGDSTADHTHVDATVAQTLRDAMRDKPALDFPAPPKRLVGERRLVPSTPPSRPSRH